MSTDEVGAWMTCSPISIGPREPAREAEALFRKHRIRHLPVVEAGRLVGLLCERDLQVAELFAGNSAMATDVLMGLAPIVVPKTALVADVAADMADRCEDAAVVMDGDVLLGVFTTADALRALASLATRARDARRPMKENRHEAH